MILVPRSLHRGPKGANPQTCEERMTKIRMALLLRTSSCMLPLVAGVACGSKAGEDYKGTPLFQISGSVRIENDEAPDDLVPALAFNTEDGLVLQDVEVRGEFPAKFTLSVYEPPPPGTVFRDGDDPEIGLAYLTAVPRDHEAFMVIPRFSGGGYQCGYPERRTYETESRWCTPEDECYVERTQCTCVYKSYASSEDPDETCEILETSGDPALKNPWPKLGGLSENYLVAYFPEESLAVLNNEGFYSQAYTGGKGFKVGYNLFHIRNTTPEEQAAARECQDALLPQAWDDYNAEHGTAYSGDTIPKEYFADDPYWAAQDWVMKRYEELVSTVYCPSSTRVQTVVDPETTSIEVRLGKVERRPFTQ